MIVARRPPLGRLAGAILGGAMAAIALAGCSLLDRPPTIIDGLSVGPSADCGACDQPQPPATCTDSCASIASLAQRHLDEQFPGHPAVATWSFHGESWYPGPSGEKELHTRSGYLLVAVATFADGTRHAVSVDCGVGGCR